MARINNLTNFLTDVATAIKTKTEDSTPIPASQFDTKISNITTGHLDNTEYQEANDDLDDILEGSTPTKVFPPDWSEIGYSDTPQNIIDAFDYAKEIYDNWDSSITNLSNKFINDTELIYIPLIDTHNATNMSSFLAGCSKLKEVPLLNTENVTNMQLMFRGCSSLKTVPLFDTGKVTSTYNMFGQCENIESIPKFDTKNVTTMFVMFQGCSNLEEIPLLDSSKVTNLFNTFSQCSKLSNESLNNILKMCINATSYTGVKTLKQLGLTSDQATICQGLSNYNDFIAVGWTTGY